MSDYLPEYIPTSRLKKMGFTGQGVAHLKMECGKIEGGMIRVGRYYYVRSDVLERVLSERQVKAS